MRARPRRGAGTALALTLLLPGLGGCGVYAPPSRPSPREQARPAPAPAPDAAGGPTRPGEDPRDHRDDAPR